MAKNMSREELESLSDYELTKKVQNKIKNVNQFRTSKYTEGESAEYMKYNAYSLSEEFGIALGEGDRLKWNKTTVGNLSKEEKVSLLTKLGNFQNKTKTKAMTEKHAEEAMSGLRDIAEKFTHKLGTPISAHEVPKLLASLVKHRNAKDGEATLASNQVVRLFVQEQELSKRLDSGEMTNEEAMNMVSELLSTFDLSDRLVATQGTFVPRRKRTLKFN